MKIRLVSLLVICIGGSGCALEAGRELSPEETFVREAEQASVDAECNPSNPDRLDQTSVTGANRAIGNLNGCTASIIHPWHVVSAAHCVTSLNGLTFRPHFGMAQSGQGPTAVPITRAVRGQIASVHSPSDWPGDHQSQDWVILTLDRDIRDVIGSANYAEMSPIVPANPPQAGTSVSFEGYGGIFANRPARQTCKYREYARFYDYGSGPLPNAFLKTDCDWYGGDSGGPLFKTNGSQYDLYGVLASGLADYCSANAGSNPGAAGSGATITSAESFAHAPNNASGLGAVLTPDSRIVTYAADADRWRMSYRHQTGDSNTPWTYWLSFEPNIALSSGSRVAAININSTTQLVTVIDSAGVLKYRTLIGSWSSWQTLSMPAPIKDVAISGGSGAVHIFALGTDGKVYYTWNAAQTGLAWTSIHDLGPAKIGTRSIAAYYSGPGTHRVVVTAAGNQTWTSSGTGSGMTDLALISELSPSYANYAVALGKDRIGTEILISATSGNAVRSWTRSGGTWQGPVSFGRSLPLLAGGIRSLNTIRDGNNVPHLFATTTSGEIFVMVQKSNGSWGPWNQAYDARKPFEQ